MSSRCAASAYISSVQHRTMPRIWVPATRSGQNSRELVATWPLGSTCALAPHVPLLCDRPRPLTCPCTHVAQCSRQLPLSRRVTMYCRAGFSLGQGECTVAHAPPPLFQGKRDLPMHVSGEDKFPEVMHEGSCLFVETWCGSHRYACREGAAGPGRVFCYRGPVMNTRPFWIRLLFAWMSPEL